MSQANQELITSFYEAMAQRDHATVGSMYAENATFKDEGYDLKNGKQVASMWAMLLSRAKDYSLEFSNVQGTEAGGSAQWIVRYKFRGKNPVENHIKSQFTVENGKIVKQRDTFDFHKWASQALGWKGKLFGWFPPFQSMLSSIAMKGLHEYMAKQEQEQEEAVQ